MVVFWFVAPRNVVEVFNVSEVRGASIIRALHPTRHVIKEISTCDVFSNTVSAVWCKLDAVVDIRKHSTLMPSAFENKCRCEQLTPSQEMGPVFLMNTQRYMQISAREIKTDIERLVRLKHYNVSHK